MSGSLQAYLATAIPKSQADLEAAFLRLPEDRRTWSPQGGARTAADMLAECALLNGSVADMLRDRAFPGQFDMEAYQKAKGALAQDLASLPVRLRENTARAVEALAAVPDADLANEIEMPWGPMALSQIMAYPYWNMCYHEGQINYIASMLGCLTP